MKASVIVLNHDGGALVEECIAALLLQDYPDYELILLDNASSDGSAHRVRDRFAGAERLRIHWSPVNTGCAGGRNEGMRQARGDVFCFVDSDAVADRGWLRGLVAALDGPRVGVAASRLLLGANALLLNGLGGGVNAQGYGFDLAFGEPADFTELPSAALFASGNGLAVKREVVERVGGFDAAYFNYYEDVDLCLRAVRAGYRVALAPDATLRHFIGGGDGGRDRKQWLCERNRLRTVLKHYPLRRLLPWLAREWRHEREVVRRRQCRRTVFLRAWAWNLWHLAGLAGGRVMSRLPPLDLDARLAPEWGHAPFKSYNLDLRPDRRRWGAAVTLGPDDEGKLLYGWHYREAMGGVSFRWTDDLAALALHRAASGSATLRLEYCWAAPSMRTFVYLLHPESGAAFSAELPEAAPHGWARFEAVADDLPAGELQVILQTPEPFQEPGGGRRLGLALRECTLS